MHINKVSANNLTKQGRRTSSAATTVPPIKVDGEALFAVGREDHAVVVHRGRVVGGETGETARVVARRSWASIRRRPRHGPMPARSGQTHTVRQHDPTRAVEGSARRGATRRHGCRGGAACTHRPRDLWGWSPRSWSSDVSQRIGVGVGPEQHPPWWYRRRRTRARTRCSSR